MMADLREHLTLTSARVRLTAIGRQSVMSSLEAGNRENDGKCGGKPLPSPLRQLCQSGNEPLLYAV